MKKIRFKKQRFAILILLVTMFVLFMSNSAIALDNFTVDTRDQLRNWADRLYKNYWPADYVDYFVNNAIEVNNFSLYEHYGPDFLWPNGSQIQWSWTSPYLSGQTPDSNGLYWYWLKGAYGPELGWSDGRFFDVTKNVWWDPINNIIVAKECGNFTYNYDVPPAPPRFPKIYGYKWNDLNENGKWDVGELPLGGWTIKLYYSDGRPVLDINGNQFVTVTRDDGYFEFDLKSRNEKYDYPQNFIIKEDSIPDGWINTYSPPVFTITMEQKNAGVEIGPENVGNYKYGVIEGYKFEDFNKNDVYDTGEKRLPGWTINLYELDRNDNEIYLRSTITDGSGYYRFDHLDAGTYLVREVQQDGWVQTMPKDPHLPYYQCEIQSDSVNSNNDFGNFKLGIEYGVKFEDMTKNSIKDTSDPRLSDWTINLYKLVNGNEVFMKSIKTDRKGNYLFDHLDVGTYRVREVQEDGWVQTIPGSGYYEFTLNTSGQVIKDKDFGNFQLGIEYGVKFEDMTKNGIKDTGDPRLSGWTVNLYKVVNGNEVFQNSIKTDTKGYYQFDHLDVGTYRVREVQQDGWVQTMPEKGYYEFNINTSGQVIKDQDFGNFKLGIVTGYKFFDINGNGKYEPELGESLLNGWKIQLYKVDANGNETLLDDNVTGLAPNQEGWYTFKDLDLGKYRLREVNTDPLNWKQTCPSLEDVPGGGNLSPQYWEFEITHSSYDSDGIFNFGNWLDVNHGKTKGWWMRIYDTTKPVPNPDSDLYIDYQNRQAYVDYINQHSTVFGNEPYGFGMLTVDNVYNILKTDDSGTGDTALKARNMMESQFLANWLNIAASYVKPDSKVYLKRVTGTPVNPCVLFGGEVVTVQHIIDVTDQAVTKSLQYGDGSPGTWGHDEYITAHEVYTFLNEAENHDGAPYRPFLILFNPGV